MRTAAVQLVAKDGHRATLRLRQLGTSPAIVTREETVRLTNNDTALSLFVVSNVLHDISLPAWIHLRRKVAEAGGTRYDLAADTRNVCVMSAQESGGAGIELASGGNIRFYAYVGGSYKVLKGTVDAEPGKAYHVVATYDAAAGKTCLYVNGKTCR